MTTGKVEDGGWALDLLTCNIILSHASPKSKSILFCYGCLSWHILRALVDYRTIVTFIDICGKIAVCNLLFCPFIGLGNHPHRSLYSITGYHCHAKLGSDVWSFAIGWNKNLIASCGAVSCQVVWRPLHPSVCSLSKTNRSFFFFSQQQSPQRATFIHIRCGPD